MTRHEGNVQHAGSEEVPSSRGYLARGSWAGNYTITGFVARGGCGDVYDAEHGTTHCRAAVKVLHSSLASLPKMVERFAREVEILRLLQHPNIVEIFEIGVLPDGRPFYVMEYLEARTLSTILQQDGRFSPAEALFVLEPVCDALATAHAAGVIHRDVKASNVCVSNDAQRTVKLLDFGIAKLLGPRSGPRCLTSEGRQVGTLTIMAPEQILGRSVDARIDVYALGILLFRLLTGRLPFDGKNATSVAQQHLEDPVPRPSHRVPVAPALDAVVLRAMEKQPERRFQTVGDFLSELRVGVGKGRARHGTPPDATAKGVAIYVEARLHDNVEEIDPPLAEDIAFILDLAEEMLEREGFILASVTGSEVLGVRALPCPRNEGARATSDAIDLASLLHAQIGGRHAADPRVLANVSVHVADVTLTLSPRPEVLGGPLVQTAVWAPKKQARGPCVTPEALSYDEREPPSTLDA